MGRSPLTQVHTARKSWLSVRTPSSVDCQRFSRNNRPAARPQGPSMVLGIVPPSQPTGRGLGTAHSARISRSTPTFSVPLVLLQGSP